MAQTNQNISDSNNDLQTLPLATSSSSASSNSNGGELMPELEVGENLEIQKSADPTTSAELSWMTYEGKTYTYKTPMEIAELKSIREKEENRSSASRVIPKEDLELKREEMDRQRFY